MVSQDFSISGQSSSNHYIFMWIFPFFNDISIFPNESIYFPLIFLVILEMISSVDLSDAKTEFKPCCSCAGSPV